jgi:hypothetical protein
MSSPDSPVGPDRDREAMEAALAATVANAAAGGVEIGPDEQALIRLHQTGGIDDEEFLRRARALAERKAAEQAGRAAWDWAGESDA